MKGNLQIEILSEKLFIEKRMISGIFHIIGKNCLGNISADTGRQANQAFPVLNEFFPGDSWLDIHPLGVGIRYQLY